ncbi:hypothetical protein GGF46_003922 [Coemansia sp. RSA 552]|nr:hypothetical protein GGF46_003922 [Coemansia sp. RSA 552]
MAEEAPRKRARIEEPTTYELPGGKISYTRLAQEFPELKDHLHESGDSTWIDFRDATAVRLLNRALLKVYFDLDVVLPSTNLCPPVANRLNYIKWIRDNIVPDLNPAYTLAGLDVGTGASCIYPLLGARVLQDCLFVGTETIEESVNVAQDNISRNSLQSRIQLYLNADPTVTLPLDDEKFPQISDKDGDGSQFAFSMCNPPFYSGEDERRQLARQKDQAPHWGELSGKNEELYTEGGEEAFLSRMVSESAKLGPRIKWYSTMVGKKATLALLKTRIREEKAKQIREGTLLQGRTTRWVLAWTFLDKTRFCLDMAQSSSIGDAQTQFCEAAADLNIETQSVAATETQLLCVAREKTWTRQWRRQQQKLRAEGVEPTTNSDAEPVLQFRAVFKANDGPQVDLFLEPGFSSNMLMSLYNHLTRRMAKPS